MQELLEKICLIAHKAGDGIMEVYESGDFDTEIKNDEGFKSPLTRADKAAHQIIEDSLRQISQFPIISEEGSHEIGGEDKFWLVDPLDGTKEFIKKNGEFTVNIALIEGGRPVLGVVYAPAKHVLYVGAENSGAWKVEKGEKSAIKSEFRGKIPIVITSRSHRDPRLDNLLESIGEYKEISMGSSLKLCLIAEGKAQLYPRLAPTMLWDTAAADAIVRAAGGSVRDLTGKPLIYQPQENLKNPFFVTITESDRLFEENKRALASTDA